MTIRARAVALGLLASASLGVAASLTVASASNLSVDGGVIQVWNLPARVSTTDPAVTDDPTDPAADEPVPGDEDAEVTPAATAEGDVTDDVPLTDRHSEIEEPASPTPAGGSAPAPADPDDGTDDLGSPAAEEPADPTEPVEPPPGDSSDDEGQSVPAPAPAPAPIDAASQTAAP